MLSANSLNDQFQIDYPAEDTNYLVVTPLREDTSLLELNPNLIRELYKSFGAIVFRGFSSTIESFKRFSDAYMTHSFKNRSANRELVDKAGSIQTVNLGSKPFPLHPEMSQTFLRPDICWFYCVKSPRTNGQTTLCDGTQIPDRLKPETLALLLGKHLRYKIKLSLDAFKTLVEGRYRSWQEALSDPSIAKVFRIENGTRFVPQALFDSRVGRTVARCLNFKPTQIVQDSVLPCLHRPIFSDRLAFGNFILFSRLLHRTPNYPTFGDGALIPDELVAEIKEVSDQLTCSVVWQDQDLLMLDNSRFMHGRNKVDDLVSRIIYTRFGMLGFN